MNCHFCHVFGRGLPAPPIPWTGAISLLLAAVVVVFGLACGGPTGDGVVGSTAETGSLSGVRQDLLITGFEGTYDFTAFDDQGEPSESGTIETTVTDASVTALVTDSTGTYDATGTLSGILMTLVYTTGDGGSVRFVLNFSMNGVTFTGNYTFEDEDEEAEGNGGEDAGGGDETFPDVISMITPYVSSADIKRVGPYSSDDSAPWGYAHSGLDLTPHNTLAPFRAVSSGVIESVRLFFSSSTLHWDVEVVLRYNSTYTALYVFEPFRNNKGVGDAQLANIAVTQGQSVAQGDIIGYLHMASVASHVHFGLFAAGSGAVCPELFFTGAARSSILGLIHQEEFGWNMCY